MKTLQNILLLTNILTPYRRFFFERFHEACSNHGISFNILVMRNTESDRHWKYDEYKTDYTELVPCKEYSIAGKVVSINPKIVNYVKKYNPQILIFAGGYDMISNWLILRKRHSLNIPMLFWSESHLDEVRNYSKLKILIRNKIRHYWYSHLSGFWTAGRKSRDFIEEFCDNSVPFYFLPNLIETEAFSPISLTDIDTKKRIRQHYGIPIEKKMLFCPARVNRVKGIHKFMDIWKNVRRKESACIVIAGDGDCLEEFRQKANELNLDIRFLGYKNQNEVIELYKASDIFLMPSLSDPNPLSVIEALWGGKPLIVTTHVGNHPEAVKNRVNGVVINYDNASESVKLIEYIITADEKWFSNAKETSQDIARTLYNPDFVIDNVLDKMIEDYLYGRMMIY